MKYMKTLVVILLLAGMLLGGCSFSKKQMAQAPDTIPTEPTTPIILPPQQALDEATVQTIAEQTELSMLAAAFSWDLLCASLTSRYEETFYDLAHIGDIDHDGHLEMVYSDSLLTFDLSTRNDTSYHFLAGGSHSLYLTADQRVIMTYMSGGPDDIEHEDHYHNVFWTPHHAWNNSSWNMEFAVSKDYTPQSQYSSCSVDLSRPLDMTEEEYAQLLTELDMQPITTTVHDFLVTTHDAAYTNSILTGLDTYFARTLLGYQGSFAMDIDGDGHQEQLFVANDFVSPWFPHVSDADVSVSGMDYAFLYDYPHINRTDNRTGIVIADVEGNELTLRAHSLPEELVISEDTPVSLNGSYLVVDGTSYYVPGATSSQENSFAGLNDTILNNGYTSPFFVTEALSDSQNSEILCLCQRDGNWILFVIQLRNGYASVRSIHDLENGACFVTTVDGKKCLLFYEQRVQEYTASFTTFYSLRLIRFHPDGSVEILDEQYASYTNDQEDAQFISAFFDVFNKYIANAKAIRDPFSLTGQQWVDPEDVMFGEPPQEEEPEAQQEQIGFVDINDPSSWLNLREGPGLEYDCIRINPDDPESIVKQAKGSPVTVLETIETDDEEHPVWLKVRIRYLDRELIGYSSKTYIRLAGE